MLAFAYKLRSICKTDHPKNHHHHHHHESSTNSCRHHEGIPQEGPSNWCNPWKTRTTVPQYTHFEALTENAASIATLKGGGLDSFGNSKRWRTRLFGHTAFCMSPAEYYATIQHSVPFLIATAPGELTFVAGDTAVGWEDTKLLLMRC